MLNPTYKFTLNPITRHKRRIDIRNQRIAQRYYASGGASPLCFDVPSLRLGIADNDKVTISKKGSIITIEKTHKPKSLRQLVEERTGMDFDTYLQNNPYDYATDYIECGKVGSEEI